MLRAITLAKKKNDRIDAGKICDCLRCDFLPECYMAPTATRELRRTLRYRNLLVRQMVQMKDKIAMLLMEAGVSYNKQRLHKAGKSADGRVATEAARLKPQTKDSDIEKENRLDPDRPCHGKT